MSEIIVRVRYFNVLADYAGAKQAEVRVPAGMTVRGLLEHLTATNPEPFRRAVADGDALNSYLRVFHNDKLVAREMFDAHLADGDEVLLFPAIAGGSEMQITESNSQEQRCPSNPSIKTKNSPSFSPTLTICAIYSKHS